MRLAQLKAEIGITFENRIGERIWMDFAEELTKSTVEDRGLWLSPDEFDGFSKDQLTCADLTTPEPGRDEIGYSRSVD
jgi:hypothetical protein